MKKLLLTTAGGLVAALLIEMLAPWRERIHILGLNSEADSDPNFLCDTVYLVPPTDDREAWTGRVKEILRAESPDVVLPTRDGDLEPLAALVGDPACGSSLLFTPGPQSASMLVDKQASSRFARAHGLPFAETAGELAEVERLVGRTGFPILAKPRVGTGSQGVRIVRTWDEVRALLARTAPVFQEYIGDRAVLDLPILDPRLGIPYFLACPRLRTLSAVGAILPNRRMVFCGTLDITYNGASFSRLRRADDPRMEAMTRDLGAALLATDFLGLYNLQAVAAADGRLVPIEYNGRLVGAARSRAILGISEVPVLVHLLLGEPLPTLPLPHPRERELTLLRTEFVGTDNAEALRRDGVWRRSAAAGARPEGRDPAA